MPETTGFLKMIETTVRFVDHVATGEGLKHHRMLSGVSQTAIAKHWGVSSAHVSNLERGKTSWNRDSVQRYLGAVRVLQTITDTDTFTTN